MEGYVYFLIERRKLQLYVLDFLLSFTVFLFQSLSSTTASQIQLRLMGDGSDWTRAVLSWRRLQRALIMRSDCTARVVLPGRKRRRKRVLLTKWNTEAGTRWRQPRVWTEQGHVINRRLEVGTVLHYRRQRC